MFRCHLGSPVSLGFYLPIKYLFHILIKICLYLSLSLFFFCGMFELLCKFIKAPTFSFIQFIWKKSILICREQISDNEIFLYIPYSPVVPGKDIFCNYDLIKNSQKNCCIESCQCGNCHQFVKLHFWDDIMLTPYSQKPIQKNN